MQAPKNGLKADNGRSYREIERIAGRWRRSLGYDPTEQFDAHRFFEFQLADLTISCAAGEIQLYNHVQPCNEEGLTRWDSQEEWLEMVLSETSYLDLQNGLARPRFTVCHEFGHAVLHTNELIRLAGMTIARQAAMYRERGHAKCFDSEWQANAFAAATLMPAEGVVALDNQYDYVGEDLVAEHFGTSIQAARYRLESMAKL